MQQTIEKITTTKTMWHILPYILLLYIISYLDRVNLGFAALEMNYKEKLSNYMNHLMALQLVTRLSFVQVVVAMLHI